jgi:hypothetical protein
MLAGGGVLPGGGGLKGAACESTWKGAQLKQQCRGEHGVKEGACVDGSEGKVGPRGGDLEKSPADTAR